MLNAPIKHIIKNKHAKHPVAQAVRQPGAADPTAARREVLGPILRFRQNKAIRACSQHQKTRKPFRRAAAKNPVILTVLSCPRASSMCSGVGFQTAAEPDSFRLRCPL